jgi:hypothetical protein
MDLVGTYCIYNFNSIILSKLVLKQLLDLPIIKKISFFFFINKKKYKKNILLFFIVISLLFGDLLLIKKKEIQQCYIFNIILKKKKVLNFFLNFINIYLPLINTTENLIKCGIHFSNKYRLNYFHFPTIIELDKLYLAYDQVHIYLSKFQFQLDIYFFSVLYIKNILDFLLRIYRFPCYFKYTKNLC